MSMYEKIGYPSLPEGYYTLKDVMEIYPVVTDSYLRNRLNKSTLERAFYSTDGYKVTGFPAETFEVLKGIAEQYIVQMEKTRERKKQKELMLQEQKQLKLEELRKEHPLVTDVRFFDLSYFPDVYIEDIIIE